MVQLKRKVTMHRVSAKQNVSSNHQQKQACVWKVLEMTS